MSEPTLEDLLKRASAQDPDSLKALFKALLRGGFGETEANFEDVWVLCTDYGNYDDTVYFSREAADAEAQEENKRRLTKPAYGLEKLRPIEVKNLWDHIHDVKEEARYEGIQQESESWMR